MKPGYDAEELFELFAHIDDGDETIRTRATQAAARFTRSRGSVVIDAGSIDSEVEREWEGLVQAVRINPPLPCDLLVSLLSGILDYRAALTNRLQNERAEAEAEEDGVPVAASTIRPIAILEVLSVSVGYNVALTGRSDGIEDAKEATTAVLLRLIKFSDLFTVTNSVPLILSSFRRYLGDSSHRIPLRDANDAHRKLLEYTGKRYRFLCGISTLLVSAAALYDPVSSLAALLERAIAWHIEGQRWKVTSFHDKAGFKGDTWIVEDGYGAWMIHYPGLACEDGGRQVEGIPGLCYHEREVCEDGGRQVEEIPGLCYHERGVYPAVVGDDSEWVDNLCTSSALHPDLRMWPTFEQQLVWLNSNIVPAASGQDAVVGQSTAVGRPQLREHAGVKDEQLAAKGEPQLREQTGVKDVAEVGEDVEVGEELKRGPVGKSRDGTHCRKQQGTHRMGLADR